MKTKIFNESGKGYWMEGVGCIRTEGENRPSRPGHIVCVVLGCDLYNGQITGDVACNMNANSNASANHAGPSLLILNDQGGSMMDVSENVTACLRAQDHGHPPVVCAAFIGGQGAKARSIAYCDDGTTPTIKSVLSGGNTVPDVVYCFEPGIVKREGSESRFVMDCCGTLRAEMGDNQPAVCFQQNQREEVRNMGDCAGAITAESGMHNTNYVMYEVKDGELSEPVGSAEQAAVRD